MSSLDVQSPPSLLYVMLNYACLRHICIPDTLKCIITNIRVPLSSLVYRRKQYVIPQGMSLYYALSVWGSKALNLLSDANCKGFRG